MSHGSCGMNLIVNRDKITFIDINEYEFIMFTLENRLMIKISEKCIKNYCTDRVAKSVKHKNYLEIYKRVP